MSPSRRLLVLLVPGVLPWGVVTWPGGFYLLFAAGWTARGLSGVRLLPSIVRSGGVGAPAVTPWLVGSLLYALALASVALALVDREDRRLTAGLCALAGGSVLLVALRASAQRGILALPVGTATLWPAAVFVYLDRLPRRRASSAGSVGGEE